MDVRIGVSQIAKEIEVDLADGSDPAEIKATLDAALAGGTTWWITDKKGRQIGVPAEKLAYVEIGSPDEARRIGFSG